MLVVFLPLLAGCGDDDGERRGAQPATLVLDFAPNAGHAGIFSATAQGFDRAAGVALRVRQPPAGATGVRLLLTGRAELAVLDIHDLALARQQGRDVVAVAPVVQAPLAALIAGPRAPGPRDLARERGEVGVAGLPSDEAVLRSIVQGAGGDPGQVRQVTIGFNAVASLIGRRVDAVTAFWNVEGVELRRRLPGTRVFRVDRFGAPRYPELVLATTRETLRARGPLVRATARALARGTAYALRDPAGAVRALRRGNPGLAAGTLTAQLAAVAPALRPVGRFDRAALRAWSPWEARFGITERPPDVAAMFPAVR